MLGHSIVCSQRFFKIERFTYHLLHFLGFQSIFLSAFGKPGSLDVFYKFDSANSIESRFNVLRTFRPKTALHWDQQLFRQNRKYIIKSNIINKQRIPIKLFWVSQQIFFLRQNLVNQTVKEAQSLKAGAPNDLQTQLVSISSLKILPCGYDLTSVWNIFSRIKIWRCSFKLYFWLFTDCLRIYLGNWVKTYFHHKITYILQPSLGIKC